LQIKKRRKAASRGFVFSIIGDSFNNFYKNHIPFELTGAQKRVLKEIRRDMGTGIQMNRLLQGDVGSGKTMVGFLTMLMAIDNGFQACLMAPTEILAQQHYFGINAYAEKIGVKVAFLSGTVKGKKRKEILEQLENNEIQILIGTHALIEDNVIFHNLGLTIIDEQHRFGVEQRAKLWKKNPKGMPHVLVMTATPIPRTLAMSLYGDLDISVIDELPPGRKEIITTHRTEAHRLRVFGFMKEEIAKGRQVYVVYPLIEESEKLDLKNLMEGFESLSRDFPIPDYQISIVHGKMKSADKDFEMQRFVKNETQIMIATTVIEVGVNVPNASIMVIENTERFGLSQLHQLRGRVGRGADQSYCILMSSYKLSAEGRERIKTMCETTDGFKISEADLRLRGPGNIEGTQQSGVLNLRLADLSKDGELLQTARNVAIEIMDEDAALDKIEYAGLKKMMSLMDKQSKMWSRIS
jgi:ATP-dependent DNA helicase RecG